MANRILPPQQLVYAAFFVYSMVLGGLFPRLGDLQLSMGISEGVLGISLIGSAIGVQISLTFASRVVDKVGYGLTLMACIPLLGLAETIATLAPGPLSFFFILVAAGLTIGSIELVVNLEADRTEHMIGKRIMNRSHAFWSLGFFTAGMIGAVAKQIGIDPTTHLAIMTGIGGVASFILFRNFQPAPLRVADEGAQPLFVRPSGPILILVAFTLSAMLLEGAGIDWSVIFMRDVFGTAPFLNGMALALGALTQGIVRYFADGFVDRLGPVRVARISIFVLGIGVVCVAFAGHPYMALSGFALMGLGTAAIFPLAMSAAAQMTDRPSATNVASLAQLSFFTFLVAPPLLGTIAEHFGIRVSFGIGMPLVILSWFTVFVLIPKAISPQSGKTTAEQTSQSASGNAAAE